MKVVFSVFVMLSSVVGVGSVKAGTSGVDARFVRITKSDATVNPADGNRFHIGEVEVFPYGSTPAAGIDNVNDLALSSKGASAITLSGTFQHGDDAALISGVLSTGGATWSRQNPLPIVGQIDLAFVLSQQHDSSLIFVQFKGDIVR